jgi:hypothetical protein
MVHACARSNVHAGTALEVKTMHETLKNKKKIHDALNYYQQKIRIM